MPVHQMTPAQQIGRVTNRAESTPQREIKIVQGSAVLIFRELHVPIITHRLTPFPYERDSPLRTACSGDPMVVCVGYSERGAGRHSDEA